jgi:hypothetical protein
MFKRSRRAAGMSSLLLEPYPRMIKGSVPGGAPRSGSPGIFPSLAAASFVNQKVLSKLSNFRVL